MARSRTTATSIAARTFNGWEVLFNEPFTSAYGDVSARARSLKRSLPDGKYRTHPDVKLFSALYQVVFEFVPSDPDHPDFHLQGDLRRFRRVQARGLPSRYRLYFVSSKSAKVIIFLFVNDRRTLRKAGAGTDPYEIFLSHVNRGVVGKDFSANYRKWLDGHKSD